MSINTARMLNRIFSNPAWKILLIPGAIALILCFFVKGRKKTVPLIVCIASFFLYILTVVISGYCNSLIMHGAGQELLKIVGDSLNSDDDSLNSDDDSLDSDDDCSMFSEDIMFSLRIYEPWFYEDLHYTLLTDGTLIVQYYETELGREQLSEDRMDEIREIFSPVKIYSMNVGVEDIHKTDGISRYIVLYDHDDNEIPIGGYELKNKGGKEFNSLFYDLYYLMEDDYTKQWSDKLDECAAECVTYWEKYMSDEN